MSKRRVVLTGACGTIAGLWLPALRERYDLTLLDVRTTDRAGNEVAGVGPSLLEACEYQVRIPMYGVKNSLNVAVAFGIAAAGAAAALGGLDE